MTERDVRISVIVTVEGETEKELIAAATKAIEDVDFEVATFDVLPEPEDDDPLCVCGVARSEHALCGCPEGFQTAESWEAERRMIREMDDHTFERVYGGMW